MKMQKERKKHVKKEEEEETYKMQKTENKRKFT